MYQRSGRKGTILVGEDEPEVRSYLTMALECHGYNVEAADDGTEVLQVLRSHSRPIAAVILDILMPRMDGLATVREIRRENTVLPVIMISAAAAPLTIAEAMRCGATGFLAKPITHDQLCGALKQALNGAWGEQEAPALPFEDEPAASRCTGWARESESFVERVGPCDAPVLILGETGSGKEVLVRRLHARSARARKPFLKVNCAALPSELVESELFGYDRGAFTGAFQKKAGLFELADGGTLLLDEIGDMDLKLQAKLLQVLQDQTFQHLGGKDTLQVNVRVMAATHRDLEQAIEDGRFREDLYYRLSVITIRIPPLRERRSEILPLAEYFLEKYAGEGPVPLLSAPVRQALAGYGWPGNIRELENAMRGYLVLQDAASLEAELHRRSLRGWHSMEPPAPAAAAAAAASVPEAPPAPILQQVNRAKEQAEAQAILQALNSTHWNRRQAAALLGVDYKALLYRMKKLSIRNSKLHEALPAGDGRKRAGAAGGRQEQPFVAMAGRATALIPVMGWLWDVVSSGMAGMA
jgi:two-component system response regulator AtoC